MLSHSLYLSLFLLVLQLAQLDLDADLLSLSSVFHFSFVQFIPGAYLW